MWGPLGAFYSLKLARVERKERTNIGWKEKMYHILKLNQIRSMQRTKKGKERTKTKEV